MATQSSPQSAKSIGIIHPGKMGGTLAYALKRSGHTVYWASEGRSDVTEARANEFDLVDLVNINTVLSKSDFVICIAFGGAPLEVAKHVAKVGYSGIYIDANGLWGEESEKEVASIINEAGITYVEAGLYGWPYPGRDGYTDEHTLYLSGEKAQDVADLFTDGYWTTEIHETSAKEVKRLRNDRERGTEFPDKD